jgi:hypothetical protein
MPIFGKVSNLNGDILGIGSADLFNGLSAEIKYDENGEELSTYAWTGSHGSGSGTTTLCEMWSTNSSSIWGMMGNSNTEDIYWTGGYSDSCNELYSLMCIESIDIVASTPEVTITGEDLDNSTVALAIDFEGFEFANLVKLMRAPGTKHYDDSCTLGTLIDSLYLEDRDESYSINDETVLNYISKTYHYYTCAYDEYSNLLDISDNIVTVEHSVKELRVFLTDGSYSGNVTISTADIDCDDAADAAGLTGDFISALSDSSNDLVDQIGVSNMDSYSRSFYYDIAGNYAGYVYNSNGTAILDFDDGIVQTQADGSIVPDYTYFWTGTDSDGNAHSDVCNDWGDATTSFDGRAGLVRSIPGYYSTSLSFDCDSSLRILCIEKPSL